MKKVFILIVSATMLFVNSASAVVVPTIIHTSANTEQESQSGSPTASLEGKTWKIISINMYETKMLAWNKKTGQLYQFYYGESRQTRINQLSDARDCVPRKGFISSLCDETARAIMQDVFNPKETL